jgi:hypothetical protein
LNLTYGLRGMLHKIRVKYSRYKRQRLFHKLSVQNIKGIKRLDARTITHNEAEIRLFAVLRNESLRLPNFLQYYRDLGIDRFFFLDNGSTDGSVEILANQQDVYLFSTNYPYRDHWFWMEHLLDTFGRQHWCVVVDIDELLFYPGCPRLSLKDLCTFFDSRKETAYRSFLLDMYARAPVSLIEYSKGQSPLDQLRYFDSSYLTLPFTFLDRKTMEHFSTSVFTGGMRDRIFGPTTPPTLLSKVPLFKYQSGTYLVQGMHAINGATLSEMQGVVFHTKFLSDFIEEVRIECEREEHYAGAFHYKVFRDKMTARPDISFYYEGSCEFIDAQQLIDLQMMKTIPEFEDYLQKVVAEGEEI